MKLTNKNKTAVLIRLNSKGKLHLFYQLKLYPHITICNLKLFKCTFFIIIYNHYYTLYLNVKFAVNLDKISKFRIQNVVKIIV